MFTIYKALVLSAFQILINSIPRTTLQGWCYNSSYYVVEEVVAQRGGSLAQSHTSDLRIQI